MVDGEWKNAEEAELDKDYDGELVSLLIVEEEEDEGVEEKGVEEEFKEKGDIGCTEKAVEFDFEQKDKGEKLVERDQRRGVGAC